MCGIAGIIQFESKISKELRHKALRILFSELMLRTESRGEDATGLYQVMANGEWLMTKKAQKATEWVFMSHDDEKCKDPVTYTDIMDSWIEHPKELSAVVGHCRARSVGLLTNDNNHPFVIQLDERNCLLGVHNGTLLNHELIFDRLPKTIERQGTVDSEAIFHFIYHQTERGTKPITSETLQHVAKRLEGSFACVAVNSRFPNQIVVFRDGRPMEFCAIAPLNIVILASEKRFIDSSLETYKFIRKFIDSNLPQLRWENKTLLDRSFRIFDTLKEFPTEKFTWTCLDNISESGDTRAFNAPILEDWKDTPVTYPYSGKVKKEENANKPNSNLATKETGITSRSSRILLPTTVDNKKIESKEDTGVIVEVEIGSEDEANKGYEKAKLLGLCVHYDTKKEVAISLTKTEENLERMNTVELANYLSKNHFNLGYACSRVDFKNETKDIRTKGRALLGKLEKSEEKKKKAQNHVWEYRTIIQIILALSNSQYQINLANIELVIKSFQELNEDRRKAVLTSATGVFKSSDTKTILGNLEKEFIAAEEKKKECNQTNGLKEMLTD